VDDKSNALEIIRFGRPERIASGPPQFGIGYLGCNHEGFEGGGHHLPVGSQWTDIWGTVWRREHEGVMGFPRGNPLADLPSSLKTYCWPDPDDERISGRIAESAAKCDRSMQFLTGSHRDTLWEKAYMLAGMENVMCFFREEPNAVSELLRRIMDFQLGIARHYLAAGVEMVNMSDDLGAQRGPLFSREVLERFFMPEYRRLFDLYRSRGVLVNFHSCGNIVSLLDVFMDLGVDILNPVQASANDLDEARRVTSGRMALSGGVNSEAMVDGPVDAIRRLVWRRLWQLGRDGGYFCWADQAMPWPEEHGRALADAVREFGRYPLQPPEEK
jgi:uroporphyrinogen decarboxylase